MFLSVNTALSSLTYDGSRHLGKLNHHCKSRTFVPTNGISGSQARDIFFKLPDNFQRDFQFYCPTRNVWEFQSTQILPSAGCSQFPFSHLGMGGYRTILLWFHLAFSKSPTVTRETFLALLPIFFCLLLLSICSNLLLIFIRLYVFYY